MRWEPLRLRLLMLAVLQRRRCSAMVSRRTRPGGISLLAALKATRSRAALAIARASDRAACLGVAAAAAARGLALSLLLAAARSADGSAPWLRKWRRRR